MDTQIIITAMYNESGITKVGKTRQWAKGQVLSLVGFPNLPASFEMYFQNADGTPINAQGQIGTDGQVSIPDAFFANGSNINAWMWLPTSEDEGKYAYKFVLPVERCPRPADYTYTQDQVALVDQAIAALNDAVARTEASAQAAAESEAAAALSEKNAKASEEAAAQSAENAATSEVNASNSETAAKAAEVLAAQSAALASSYANFITDTVNGIVARIQDGADGLATVSTLLNEDDTTTVVYRADAALYIQKMIAALSA